MNAKTDTTETTTNEIRKLENALDAWQVISDVLPEGESHVVDEALYRLYYEIHNKLDFVYDEVA